jgi:hypothetical protein
MHYSWDYGLVHFISIDTETGFSGAEEETKYVEPCGGFSQNQLKWLEQDLKAANASRNLRPWIFVQGPKHKKLIFMFSSIKIIIQCIKVILLINHFRLQWKNYFMIMR